MCGVHVGCSSGMGVWVDIKKKHFIHQRTDIVLNEHREDGVLGKENLFFGFPKIVYYMCMMHLANKQSFPRLTLVKQLMR